MNKFSKKKNTIKKGGDCDYTRSQFTKVKSVLGPDGLESKISNELHKSLTGINDYLENFLQKKIRHLQQIFNSNTDRKGEILNIIKQLEEKLIDVEQKNKSCYDELIVDPRGDEFGTKTSDAKMIELFGENPDEYSAAQANYIDHLLDDHPIVGINKKQDDEEPAIVDDDAEQEAEVSESADIPDWKKRNSTKKFHPYDNEILSVHNYDQFIKNIKSFIKRSKKPERVELFKTLLPDIEKAESFEEVQKIINDNKMRTDTVNMGGGKSKRINKTRKYRSRRQ